MIVDPNWLYSTIAQASAAIVAIVGGFITATVLMLTSEKRSLTHQKTDKETRLEALKYEEKTLSEVYETMRVDKFFSSIADDLKKEEELPPLEVLLQRYPGWNLNHEILKQEYEKLSKQRLEARHFIERYSDTIDPTKFMLFDEWVKENNLDISSYDYELLEEEYNRFLTREREILEEEKRRNIPPQLRGLLDIQMPIIRPISGIVTQYELYRRQKEDRKLEDAERRLNSIRHEMLLLESEVNNLDSRLRAFSYPPNLRWGIIVLGYLAVFGILLPVLIIWKEAYSDTAKTLTMASFYIGIIGLFTYIVLQIRTMRRK